MAGSAVYRRDIDQYGTWREHVWSADDAHLRLRELLGAEWADAERYALYTPSVLANTDYDKFI